MYKITFVSVAGRADPSNKGRDVLHQLYGHYGNDSRQESYDRRKAQDRSWSRRTETSREYAIRFKNSEFDLQNDQCRLECDQYDVRPDELESDLMDRVRTHTVSPKVMILMYLETFLGDVLIDKSTLGKERIWSENWLSRTDGKVRVKKIMIDDNIGYFDKRRTWIRLKNAEYEVRQSYRLWQ